MEKKREVNQDFILTGNGRMRVETGGKKQNYFLSAHRQDEKREKIISLFSFKGLGFGGGLTKGTHNLWTIKMPKTKYIPKKSSWTQISFSEASRLFFFLLGKNTFRNKATDDIQNRTIALFVESMKMQEFFVTIGILTKLQTRLSIRQTILLSKKQGRFLHVGR